LALEEALMRAVVEETALPTVRVWRNPRCVVVGRFQDMDDEVNWEACRRFGVDVCRRISGGGAVYHDMGNLNFTIACKPEHPPLPTDLLGKFRYLMHPVVSAAQALGCHAIFRPPNAVTSEGGEKFSGSAACLTGGSILFHASILLSSDLQLMQRVLTRSPTPMSKKVQSRRMRVCNLTQIRPDITPERLIGQLLRSTERDFRIHLSESPLARREEAMTDELLAGKYASREWSRGASLMGQTTAAQLIL
jgi:lipoate-protein ligase A